MKWLVLFAATQALGHGEHLPGPNGGYVQMPAGFHVEVVPKKSALDIYLLDMDFKNPVVDGSDVKASIHRGTKILSLSCTSSKTNFVCLLPKGEQLKNKGELKIRANRLGVEANEATYPLPLKRPAAPKTSADPHSTHSHSGH